MTPASQLIIRRLKAATLPWQEHVTEKRMFGGHCFLYKGKMCVGEIREKMMVRVVADKMEKVLQIDGVTPMDFTGKPMKEFIYVSTSAIKTEEQLQYFVELGMEHAILKTDS